MFQVNKWIWPALSVERRATCLFESHSLIEANSLFILLVDIGRHFWMKHETVFDEGSTNPVSSPGGINE